MPEVTDYWGNRTPIRGFRDWRQFVFEPETFNAPKLRLDYGFPARCYAAEYKFRKPVTNGAAETLGWIQDEAATNACAAALAGIAAVLFVRFVKHVPKDAEAEQSQPVE